MATRKQAPKQTVVDTPFVETVHGAAPDTNETLKARLHAAIDDMVKDSVVSWKRMLIAWIVGLAAGFGVSYLATALVSYTVVGALLLTGSAFFATAVYVIGVIITMYASYRASVWVHLRIIDKSVDAVFVNTSNKVRGWFGSSAIKFAAS